MLFYVGFGNLNSSEVYDYDILGLLVFPEFSHVLVKKYWSEPELQESYVMPVFDLRSIFSVLIKYTKLCVIILIPSPPREL